MYLEQNNKNKWVLVAVTVAIVAVVGVMAMFLNKPQTYKTPAAERTGNGRSIVCKWESSQLPQDARTTLSLVDKDGKVIRAIPNPSGSSYTFEDVNPSSFPARCRFEVVGGSTGIEACVKEVQITCDNTPTNTPTPVSPTATPGGPTPTQNPTATPRPGGPTSTPAPTNKPPTQNPPIGGPSGPTNTPVPLGPTSTPRPGGPTSTPAPTNTSVPNAPTQFPELPKAGVSAPTMLIVAMGVVILLLAFAL